jgi:hypothetical protein
MMRLFLLLLLVSCTSPAQKLVEEYLARDARGEFLQTNAWWNQSVMCPDCMGGPDFYTVINSYEITPKNSHEFLVTYSILGTQSPNGFQSDAKTLNTLFKVIETKDGLKLEQGAYQMVKRNER